MPARDSPLPRPPPAKRRRPRKRRSSEPRTRSATAPALRAPFFHGAAHAVPRGSAAAPLALRSAESPQSAGRPVGSSVDTFIQQLVNGITLGSVYAIVALGYTMVYGIIQLINFAHGEVVMIGAMVAFTVINAITAAHTGLPPLAVVVIGTLVAIPVCMLVGY